MLKKVVPVLCLTRRVQARILSTIFFLLNKETVRVRFGWSERRVQTIAHWRSRRVTSPSDSLGVSRCWRTDGHSIVSPVNRRKAGSRHLAPALAPSYPPRITPRHRLVFDNLTSILLPSGLMLTPPLPRQPHFLPLISLSLILAAPWLFPAVHLSSSLFPTFYLPTVSVCRSLRLQCHKPLGRSHSLLLHLFAWSPISLYQHFHLLPPQRFPSPPLSLCLFRVITLVRPGICESSPPKNTKWTNPGVTSRWKARSEFKAALARQVEI